MSARAPQAFSTWSLHPVRQPGWREATLALAAFAIALFLVWQLIPMYGISVAAVLTAPLAALAWRFGLKGALWGSAIALPLSMAVCLKATHEPMLLAIVSGHLGVLVIACVTGRLRDLSVRIGSELEEHARAVRLLRRGEARNQALLGALPDLIFRLDGSGKVTGASGARGRASSLRSATYLDQLLPVEAAELLRERVREVLSRGEPGELEYSVNEQAETRDYEARLVKCAPDQVLAIIRNVTRQKRLERELIAAKEAALEAARSKTKFLANMSHEIRTPMNGVIGMTHLLLETALGQEQREYAQIIQKSGQSLLLIIDDILDFAKIEAGRLELDKFEFDLHVCVEESIESFAGQAHLKGLDLGCVIDERLPRRMVGDATRLRQVLANVLGNAVKYTESGFVQLEVELVDPPEEAGALADVSERSARVRFRVRDTGTGVPRELVPRLFKPLLLGENGDGNARDGTGLGLAIARELVQLMNGEIRYEGQPGQGAVFCFVVQLELAAKWVAPLPRPDLKGARVLLVRATAAPPRLLDAQLRSLGLEPGYASEGEVVEALSKARATGRPYLAVLLEGGRDVAAEERLMATLRRDDTLEPVPVVLIQAGEPRTALTDELRRSATRVLPWPVRRSELTGCLAALLGRSEPVVAVTPALAALPEKLSAHVLVAEDNPINQRVAQRTLELLGCTSELVENGELAVAAVLAGKFDVVLMDCQMPVLDGFEAARQIRAREHGRRTPIVAMTAGMADSDRERCREVEMDAYLTKPATLEQLREVIAKLLTASDDALPEQSRPQPAEVLDRGALAELNVLGGGDPEFVRELVRLFDEQAPRYLEVARVALDVGDLQAVAKAAHAMKSSSGYLGARRVSELCRQLEQLAKAGDGAAVSRLIEALTAEYDAARHALTAEVG
ncbi:MAG: Histidine kinase [Myxococcaceae bacterium]|nr:Histidine kinase [Myxococcaceae bacterium]